MRCGDEFGERYVEHSTKEREVASEVNIAFDIERERTRF